MLFALVGNQNCGKTTLFNRLTGSNQHVGNFPGVTVEKKEGIIRGCKNARVVDLPGIYSLPPYTIEEVITRNFIVNEKPDCIINIVDATNIERNLYLTTQLLELNIPMVVALNMMDEVRANSGCVKLDRLQNELGVPVVGISAGKKQGIDELVEVALNAVKRCVKRDDGHRYSMNADMRYRFIERLCARTVLKQMESREHRRSVKIDLLLTHKWLGIPIFLGIMLLVFWLTFGVVGSSLSDVLSRWVALLTQRVNIALEEYNVSPVIQSLVLDGVFAGVGSVVSFVPTIVVLFFFLSMLEDSGYMARVSFMMDKLLFKLGLSGRSFVALLIGFGCSVPAVMAARTLQGERDRKMTALLVPFISCSAKLPIYGIFTMTFFQKYRALVMIGLYIFGIIAGIASGLLFKNTIFRGNPTPFIMELPNYRMPSLKSVMLLLRDKAKDFLNRAFTVIFLASVVIWFLQTFDVQLNMVYDSAQSILADIGRILAPVFAPLGFGDWRVCAALITGLTAKETVISTFAVLCGGNITQLPAVLSGIFTPLSALAFLVFTLLYTPCIAAVNTVRTELGSGWTALGMMVYQTGIAWLCAACVYQIGLLI